MTASTAPTTPTRARSLTGSLAAVAAAAAALVLAACTDPAAAPADQAADNVTDDATGQATSDARPEQPALSAALAPLAPMLGEWDCQETYHAGGFSPTEGHARGVDVIRVGPGGNAVIADYHSDGDFGPYTAHDMITWDAASQRFRYLFIDSFGPDAQLHAGQAAGATFVFEGPFALGGKPGTMRRTYKDLTATSGTLVADFVDGTGAVTKLVTIQKQRRK